MANPPTYLQQTKIALANNLFQDLDSEEALKDVEQHLMKRYNLLERVIRARKLHHSRFFASTMDYGHQHFLDNLANQKSIVARAIERVTRRLADVLFEKQKWFDWVRRVQDEDDAHRAKEKERVKQEAILFQRHWKAVEARKQLQREKENAKRQEKYLEKAYQHRLVLNEQEVDEEWDPIEDVVEYDRGSFVDILLYFVWQHEATDVDTKASSTSGLSVEAGQNGAFAEEHTPDKDCEASATGSSTVSPAGSTAIADEENQTADHAMSSKGSSKEKKENKKSKENNHEENHGSTARAALKAVTESALPARIPVDRSAVETPVQSSLKICGIVVHLFHELHL